MIKQFAAVAAAAVALAAAQPAAASHIFFSNIQIDGVALDSTSGATNPLFNVNVGDSLTFTVDGEGAPGDSINVWLSGLTGATPITFSFPFSGGDASFSKTITFSTAGLFNASAFLDIPSSNPDYHFPDGSIDFGQDGYTLPFRVNVSSGIPGAVPEPATWAMMLMGFFGLGGLLRQRRGTTATA